MSQSRFALHASLIRYAACAGLALAQPSFANTLPAGCSLNEQWSLPLTFTEDLRPVGQASVNGSTVPVMLSTAEAKGVVFNKKVLDRLGVKLRVSTGFMSAADERNPGRVDIVEDVTLVALTDFSFGPIKSRNASYFVEDFLDDSFGLRIGANVLLKTDIEIALDAGHIKSFQPKGCFREHLAYWDPKAVPVLTMSDPFQRDMRMLFNVRIGGKDVRAMLSTSTPHSYLPKAAGERLGLTSAAPGATREDPLPGHGPDKPVWKLTVPLMSMGALDVKDAELRLVDLPHQGEILILGADFLHRHRVYIARSQNLVYLSPIATPRVLKRGAVQVIPQALD